MGEHVESIEFSLDIQLNFVFLHVDPFLLMCLSTRGLAISSRFSSFLGLLCKFLYIFGNPGLLCAVPAKAKADIARAFNLSRCNCVLTLT